MNIIKFAGLGVLPIVFAITLGGCASRQYGHMLASNDKDLVGSHAAGAATWNPLVESSVAQLLSRCPPPTNVQLASATMGETADGMGDPTVTVCFIGVENKSAEELGDFKDQIYETIDSQVTSTGGYRGVSRRLVDAALRETRMRPDALFLPANREMFAAVLGRSGMPADYLLYAVITSGTTDRNKTSQRDYTLTLEMVNVHTGDYLKESAKIRKGYSKSRVGKWWNWGAFDQADG